jgi:hypothetical protein
MAKFNKTNTSKKTTNLEGGIAYERNDFKKEIVSIILNSMLKGDTFYQTETEQLKNIENIISKNIDDAEFIAKAMVYVRNEGNLRSISHYLAVLLSEKVKGTSYMKNALAKIMVRPDDATEIISLWNTKNKNKMIPNPIRKATKYSLEKRWDAYQLKKYYGNGAVKVSNLINLTHPAPSDKEQEKIFKQALENTLPSIKTAQTVNAGSTGKDRAKAYFKMLKNNKLGYMGLLKNLKNILEVYSELSEKKQEKIIELICDLLENEKACLKSRVLPFRFVQAYENVLNLNLDRIKVKKILNSIEKGFILSSKNIPIVKDGEKIALLLDESYSMGQGYNSPFGIGKTLMSSMLSGLDKENTIGYLWANNSREISIDNSPMDFVRNTFSKGGGTDVWAPVYNLIKTNTFVDKIVIFTDMQMYDINRYGKREFKSIVSAYKKINPNVKILFWNLNNYGGATPIKLSNNVLEVSGYSDKLLDVIGKIWNDPDALIKEIENISI